MPETYRYRITFAKNGALKYTSHLDLMRVWERALRRAGVPLAYSGGYNPRPKLQLAKALPLGHVGEAELLDIWLEEPLPVEDCVGSLAPVLPDGLAMVHMRRVGLDEPAMQTQVESAEYRVIVEWDEPPERVKARLERVWAAEELPHERRGKRYDLRPLIERLWLERCTEPSEGRAGQVVLGVQLAARAGATGRPEALLDVLGMGEAFASYHRRRLLR